MRRTKADAEATRQKILSAAERVFYEKGVSNTTLEEIAKAAGVTRGAIYWHFANKTDLFLALHDAVPLPQEDMVAREIEAEAADTLSILEGAMGDWLDVLAADEQRQRILTIKADVEAALDVALLGWSETGKFPHLGNRHHHRHGREAPEDSAAGSRRKGRHPPIIGRSARGSAGTTQE